MNVVGRTILVIASGTDNDIAVVDMADPTNVVKIPLFASSSTTESTGGGGDGRSVEWADGTDLVWITGTEANEMYVLRVPNGDITKARVIQTIQGVDATVVLYVENFGSKMIGTVQAESALRSSSSSTARALSIAGIVLSSAALLAVAFLVFTRSSNNNKGNSNNTSPLFGVKSSTTNRTTDDPETALDTKSLGSKQVS